MADNNPQQKQGAAVIDFTDKRTSDNDAHLRTASSAINSQPARHLDQVLRKDLIDYLNALPVPKVMEMAISCRNQMQQIHESIYTQYEIDAERVSEQQYVQMKSFVLDHCKFNDQEVGEWVKTRDEKAKNVQDFSAAPENKPAT